jgi:hypothetical protein
MPQFPTPNQNYGTTQNSIYSSNLNQRAVRQSTFEHGAKFSGGAATLNEGNPSKETGESKREKTLASIKGSQNEKIDGGGS